MYIKNDWSYKFNEFEIRSDQSNLETPSIHRRSFWKQIREILTNSFIKGEGAMKRNIFKVYYKNIALNLRKGKNGKTRW
jgi:hypothetical protein